MILKHLGIGIGYLCGGALVGTALVSPDEIEAGFGVFVGLFVVVGIGFAFLVLNIAYRDRSKRERDRRQMRQVAGRYADMERRFAARSGDVGNDR